MRHRLRVSPAGCVLCVPLFQPSASGSCGVSLSGSRSASSMRGPSRTACRPRGRVRDGPEFVRRVRDLNKKAAAGQDELFPVWRYHAVFTDSPFGLVQAEGQHRDHAVVEQVFADVTNGPLAHLPSGKFAANAAWLAVAAMAHNLVRAAGALASLPFAKARAATIRRDLIAVAGRTARTRTRPPHPAPARRLAPRAGMAQPARHRLRPARRSGLTSPDRSAPRRPQRPPEPRPQPVTPDKPQARRAAGRPRPHSPRKTPRAGIEAKTIYQNGPVDRGLASSRYQEKSYVGADYSMLMLFCRCEGFHRSGVKDSAMGAWPAHFIRSVARSPRAHSRHPVHCDVDDISRRGAIRGREPHPGAEVGAGEFLEQLGSRPR